MQMGMGRSGAESFPFPLSPAATITIRYTGAVFKAWHWSCVQMFRLVLSSHIYFLLFDTPIVTLCLLAPETRAVAMRVSGSKWIQSTELDIVSGSLCNLCALTLGLAFHVTVLMSPCQQGRNSYPLLLSCFSGSCHVWCLKTSCTCSLTTQRIGRILDVVPCSMTLLIERGAHLFFKQMDAN